MSSRLSKNILCISGSGLGVGLWIWLAISTEAFCQTPVQRDQQAITIVNQTEAACGGPEQLASIQDFVETGTISYNFADRDTGNVTVKDRGMHQFKIEADLNAGWRITVVNGDGGLLKEPDGRTRPIFLQSARDLGSLTLPTLSLIAAEQDSSMSLIYAGLVTHNGAASYDIRLQRTYSQEQDPRGTRGKAEARDFYVDPTTFVITAVSDRFHFGGPDDQGVLHEVLYSNYQKESGIMVPLDITESVRGVTGLTMTLNQITFNSGLGNSEFAW